MKRERLYIDGNNARFTRRDLTIVDVELFSGETIEGVEPRRLFPLSGTDRYITLLDQDQDEVGIIRDINDLSEEGKKTILSCLDEYYRIPKITAIKSITEKFGKVSFSVVTDKGEHSFDVRNIVHSIKLVCGTRVLIRDSTDNRYEIPDLRRLDKRSRNLIDFYL
ncbi:MAG: DUF1854 domain-containing protein [Clostridia bacterium]|nr:DUF1854 domain-containing protein [Clostridia bacterium]